jgi:predicted Zn-dependent protease
VNAERALEDGQPARAVELLERAEQRDGIDRGLLDVLARARAQAGDAEREHEARARLAALLSGRLF